MRQKDLKSLKAKKCYGHLGGKLGERIFDRFLELQWFAREEEESTVYEVTEKGLQGLKKLGVNLK
jgi:predicted transcriptional regulator